MAEFDSEASLREAYQRLPLDRFLTEHGIGPKNAGETWKAFECPFCHRKKKAGIFERDGVEMMRCFINACIASTAMTQVGFLELKGMSRSDAFQAFLREAGVWNEPEKKAPVDTAPPSVAAAPPEEVIDKETIRKATELVHAEKTASVPFLKENLHVGYEKAAAILKALEKHGVIGPARANAPREVFLENVVPLNAATEAAQPAAAKPAPKPDDEEVSMGMVVLREFYRRLEKTDSQMAAYLEDGSKVPNPLPGEVAKRLKFRPVSMAEKRGLATSTCLVLGFAANTATNRQILVELEKDYSVEEREASGLWLPQDRRKKQPHRPNKQFFGLGQLGKKPDCERRNKEDKWQWGQCEPVLIPYFDEGGKLIKLRPHKGGAPASTVCGTSRVYIPRDPAKCPDLVETFSRVVITEGEFKAAALWQTIGCGRYDGKSPTGVCAIPGINFGKDFILREELDAWLQSVQCRTVIVSFDDHDKSAKPLRERHEAIIWAQYLAADIARKLHINGRVHVLPKEWRDENGKSDWDGAIAMLNRKDPQQNRH